VCKGGVVCGVFVSEVREVCLCCTSSYPRGYTSCSSVVEQATKRSGKVALAVCIVWLASLLARLAFGFWRFGSFGAKLVKFKTSTLYHVVAIKLLVKYALHFSLVLIAPIGTFYCPDCRAVGIVWHVYLVVSEISISIVDVFCSDTYLMHTCVRFCECSFGCSSGPSEIHMHCHVVIQARIPLGYLVFLSAPSPV
jgi:hypothetical protein